MLAKEFAEFPSSKSENIDNEIWDIVLRIDLTNFKEAYAKKPKDEAAQAKLEEARKKLADYAKKTANKFGVFRSMYYGSVIDKMLVELKGGKNPAKMTVNLNDKNRLHFLPMKDKLYLIYGINFEQKTDVSLVKVLLQELEESKLIIYLFY